MMDIEAVRKVFGTRDLYRIMGISRADADDGKLLRMALARKVKEFNPKKVAPKLRTAYAQKYKLIEQIYALLKDPNRRKAYDDAGSWTEESDSDSDTEQSTDEEAEIVPAVPPQADPEQNIESEQEESPPARGPPAQEVQIVDEVPARAPAPANPNPIQAFRERYKGSAEERRDIRKYYIESQGDIFHIMDECFFMNILDDEERVNGIIEELIASGDMPRLTKGIKRKTVREGLLRRAREEYAQATGVLGGIRARRETRDGEGPSTSSQRRN